MGKDRGAGAPAYGGPTRWTGGSVDSRPGHFPEISTSRTPTWFSMPPICRCVDGADRHGEKGAWPSDSSSTSTTLRIALDSDRAVSYRGGRPITVRLEVGSHPWEGRMARGSQKLRRDHSIVARGFVLCAPDS